MTKLLPLCLSTVISLLAGCSGGTSTERPAFPVELGDVTEGDVPVYIESIGNVYSLQSVNIRPQVGGIILESYVKQGQYIKKGDPLYKIDPRPYQAVLEKAKAALEKDEASLKLAEITVSRNETLVKQDYVSKLAYDQFKTNVELAKAQVESDKAEIAIAQLNVEWCTPVSPLDGKVSKNNIDPGNLVTANDTTAITNIRQVTPVDIRFTVTQKDFLAIQESMKEGRLKFEAILPQKPEKPREGKIYFVDNHLDLDTGSILLRGKVPNEDEFMWPGEYVTIRLQLKIEPKAILVPEEALRMGQDGPYVYVYQPSTSTVDYRPVKKGPSFDHRVVVADGVAVGDKVVVKGQVNLRPGAKVSVITSNETISKGGKE